MIRERASIIYPAVYLALTAITIPAAFLDSPISPAAFATVMILCAPWSSIILFVSAWAMMHDDTVYGVVVALFGVAALVNSVIAYKIGYSVQYKATIGKE
jgi:hypothetical protein